jgi:hypothetical protein
LRDSVALAERIGHLRGAWRAHRLIAERLRRRGAAAEAERHETDARDAVQRAAASLTDAELRRRLLSSALGES